MKNILLFFFILIIMSCSGYKKRTMIDRGWIDGPKYSIVVYATGDPLDDDVLQSWSIPINEATCNSVDSLNKIADDFILKCKSLENCK